MNKKERKEAGAQKSGIAKERDYKRAGEQMSGSATERERNGAGSQKRGNKKGKIQEERNGVSAH